MNPVRLLRSTTGMTQKTLAARAGTSQPTIALYESGAKSPAMATLQRLARSLELELVVSYVPRLTREDSRSLAYHRAIAKILRQNPEPTILRAKRTLKKMLQNHPHAAPLFKRWLSWLGLPVEDLISQMVDPGLMARDMRQVTPFAGLLSPEERVHLLKKFRKEYGS